MEFEYKLPQNYESKNLNLSPEAVIALGKDAINTTKIESLIDKSESPEIEDLKDRIEAQSVTSLLATNNIIDQLNTLRQPKDKLEVPTIEDFRYSLDEKIEEWRKNGSLEYCTNYIEQNGGDMMLVATPNIIVSHKRLFALANEFGKSQPYATHIYEEFYKKYSAENLSGPLEVGDDRQPKKLRLSLIPTALDPNFEGTMAEQRAKLSELQNLNPNIKVPSVLDTMAYWQTLGAPGDELIGDKTYAKTKVRYFNLKTNYSNLFWSVPCSHVSSSGSPCLNTGFAEYPQVARIAIG